MVTVTLITIKQTPQHKETIHGTNMNNIRKSNRASRASGMTNFQDANQERIALPKILLSGLTQLNETMAYNRTAILEEIPSRSGKYWKRESRGSAGASVITKTVAKRYTTTTVAIWLRLQFCMDALISNYKLPTLVQRQGIAEIFVPDKWMWITGWWPGQDSHSDILRTDGENQQNDVTC